MFELNELNKKIRLIEEQFRDILEYSGSNIQVLEMELRYTANSFGGNPNIEYFLRATINDIPFRPTKFKWQMQSQSETEYINTIKSYLFDILDGLANL